MTKLKESFSWLTPGAFKIEDVGPNTIKIKGVAIPRATTSKNKRHYIDEELIKSARTWIGKPVTINHDQRRIAGHVDWMEYDKGAMEYLATINKQPYVNLIRSQDPKMQGVSIEADYLYNRCRRCGERFYDAETFMAHMKDVEHLEVSEEEPHGIKGSFLSLVVSPELPGVDGTSIKTTIFESFKWLQPEGMSQLLETVTQTKHENEEWRMKMTKVVGLRREERQPYDKQLREDVDKQGELSPAHPTEEGGHECGKGSHWDEKEGTCVPDKIDADVTDEVRTATHTEPPDLKTAIEQEDSCPEGQRRVDGECVPITEQETPVCGEGMHWDAELGTCVPHTVAEQEGHCPPGFVWDEAEGSCVAKEEPEAAPPVSAPQFVPEPPITVPKVDVATPAPALSSKTVSEQDEDSTLPPAPFPTEQTSDAAVTQTCPVNSHWDKVAGTCIPDLIPEEHVGEAPVVTDGVTISEVHLPKLLTLGEPTDTHGCEPNERWDAEQRSCVPKTDETLKVIPAVHKMDVRLTSENIKIAETLNQLNKATAVVSKNMLGLPKRRKAMAIAEASLRSHGDRMVVTWTQKALLTQESKSRKLQEALDNGLADALKKLNLSEKNYNALITTIQTQGTAVSQKNFSNLVEYIKKQNGQHATQLMRERDVTKKMANSYARLKGQLVTEIKRNRRQCTSISVLKEELKAVDAKLGDVAKYGEALAELQKKYNAYVKEQDEQPEACPAGQHRNDQGECVPDEPSPEAEETKKKITEMAAKIDNLEAKQKGDFKANAPTLKESKKGNEYVDDPKRRYKGKKNA